MGDEVIFGTVGRVKVDVDRHLELLVVCLIDQIHVADDPDDAFPFRTQLLDINGQTFVIHHLVVLEQRDHLIGSRAVDDKVRQHLVVRQRLLIHTNRAQLDIGRIGPNRDRRRRLLQEALRSGVLLGSAADTVHVKLHQTSAVLLLHDEADMQIHVGRELRAHRRPGGSSHRGILRRHAEPDTVGQAGEDLAFTLGDVRAVQLEFVGGTGGRSICRERPEPDLDRGPIHHLQCLSRPSRAIPVKPFKRRSNVTVAPFSRIRFGVASAGGRQLQRKSVRCLRDINIRGGDVNVEQVRCRTAQEHHFDLFLLRKAIHILLNRAGNAYRLCLRVIPVNGHCRGGRGRVVHHELERQLLILPNGNARGAIFGRGEDPAIGKAHHRSDEGS